MQTLYQLLRLLKPYWRLVTLLIVVSTLVVALESVGLGTVLMLLAVRGGQSRLLQVPLLGEQFQWVGELSVLDRIQLLAGVLVGLTLLRGALSYVDQLLALRLRQQVEESLQRQLFAKLHAISLQTLQSERQGGWTALLGQYTRQVGQLVLNFGQAVGQSAMLLAYVALAFVIAWPLAVLSVLTVLPSRLLLQPLLNKRLRAASRQPRSMLKSTQGVLQEQLRAMKLIRTYGREEQSQAIYADQLQQYLRHEYRAGALAALVQPLVTGMNIILLAGLLLVGARYLPGSPDVILGQIVVFVVIAFRLTGPLTKLVRFQTSLIESEPMLQSILDTLGTHYPLAPRSGHRPLPGLRQRITLEDVAFRYAPDEADVLRGVSLEIRPRQVTAIVGISGGGKSTLVSLLARLYDPTAGQITVDGVDLRELDLTAWRRRLAVISQDIILFHASVWDNLRFARSDATDEEVMDAARRAYAHEFILELPDGYDTHLREQGTRLSGGQRQRIALARALLTGADLLILDEATSELDATTEQCVRQTVHDYAQEHAVLVIAHRLANVVHADRIYVMREGTILAAGTHAELLAATPLYAQMIEAQRV